ncbi:MAG: hypothetical protein AB7K71_12630 [Polyangiaceae bacterium]
MRRVTATLAVSTLLFVACGETKQDPASSGTDAGAGGASQGGAGGSATGGIGATGGGGAGSSGSAGSSGAAGNSGSAGVGGAAGTGGAPEFPGACVERAPRACDNRAVKAANQGVCDQSGWCLENPVPYAGNLLGVYPVATNDVWAIGRSDILHFDGSKWTREFDPGGDSIWSDGTQVIATHAVGWTVYDGQQWIPWAASTHWVGKLSALSATNAWAAYRYQASHYDGNDWTVHTSPVTGKITSVGAVSATEVWLGSDDGEVYRFKDGDWTSFGSTTGSSVSIQVFAPNDVWITSPGDASGDVRHFTGGTTLEPTSVPDGNNISLIWGTAPNDVFFVSTTRGILHWNGTTLVEMPQGKPGTVTDIRGTSHSDVWAVGEDGLVVHFDGQKWSKPQALVPPTDPAALRKLDGTSTEDVWAVGGNLAAHFDGTAWTNLSPTLISQPAFSGVWVESTSSVYLTDAGGALLHYDGSQWSEVARSELTLGDVVGVGPGEVWISAKQSNDVFAVHYRDGVLKEFPVGRTVNAGDSPSAIWASSNCNVWIAAQGGAFRFDGTKWDKFPLKSDYRASAIWGTQGDDVWASVDFDTYHFDGSTFQVSEGSQGGAIWGCG